MELTQKTINWIEKEKSEIRPYYEKLDWSGEDLEEIVRKKTEAVDNFVKEFYRIMTEQKEDELIKLYAYFENLSNNRKIAFLFEEFTGIPTGKTNKQGAAAFNRYFGTKIENIIKERRIEINRLEIEKAEKIKKEKDDEIKEYFKNPIWNIEGLTKMQIGRVQKILDTEYNFTKLNRVMSQKEYIENHLEHIGKTTTNNMHKWNRRKFNNMDGREQREYEEKLLKGRTYYIELKENRIYEVPKSVFDILNLEDNTNQEELKLA